MRPIGISLSRQLIGSWAGGVAQKANVLLGYLALCSPENLGANWPATNLAAARRFVRNAGRGQPNLRYRLSERKKTWLKQPFLG